LPQSGNCVEHLDEASFIAHALLTVNGFMARQRRSHTDGFLDLPSQARLISLNLNKQMAFGLKGRPERFFDSAWRPA
jgi:hypothetical protein